MICQVKWLVSNIITSQFLATSIDYIANIFQTDDKIEKKKNHLNPTTHQLKAKSANKQLLIYLRKLDKQTNISSDFKSYKPLYQKSLNRKRKPPYGYIFADFHHIPENG